MTYLSQTKLEQRRERRATEAADAEARERLHERTIAAYANAFSVKAELDRRVGFARRVLANQITVEMLENAVAPTNAWEENRTLFAEVLLAEYWLPLVKAVETFNSEWDQLMAVAQRHKLMTADEQQTFIDDLTGSCNRLVELHQETEAALQPLFALGEGG